jgi:hypothetical protein
MPPGSAGRSGSRGSQIRERAHAMRFDPGWAPENLRRNMIRFKSVFPVNFRKIQFSSGENGTNAEALSC